MNTNKAIMVFVLKSGIELVGEASHGDLPPCWYVSRPLKHFQFPMPVQTPNGIDVQIASQLVSAFAATGQTEFRILAADLLFSPTEAPIKLRSAWIQATTGLSVPAANAPRIIT